MTILAAHPEARVSEQVIQILEFCRTEQKRQEILNYNRCILPLLQNGLLEFTIPDKPKSKLQKYKITESRFTALKHYYKQ